MAPSPESLERIKNFTHAGQGACVFLSIVLVLAIFSQSGHSDGRIGWFFALCWLSIPMIIYLVCVPMFPRTRKFGHVYAFAAVNILSIILWLSAWASVASYVSAGKAAGKAAGTNKNASGCDNFGFGSAARCKLGEATTFFGVMVMLLFMGTSYISLLAVMQFRRTGTMPMDTDTNDFAVQSQEAFSSSMRHDDFEEVGDLDARQGGRSGYLPQRQSMDDEQGLLHHADHEDLGNAHATQPGGPLNQGLQTPSMTQYKTGYAGGYGPQSPNLVGSPGYEHPPPSYGR